MSCLLVIIKNQVVDSVFKCADSEELEDAFEQACQANGCRPDVVDKENGYKELPCGGSICMTSESDIGEASWFHWF